MHKYLLALALLAAAPAMATPGLDSVVYPALINPDMTEFEVRYGRLNGNVADGTHAVVLELSHAFGHRFYGAVLFGIEGNPQQNSRLESVAAEGIYYLGNAAGLEFSLYGEVAVPTHGGPVNFEVKGLIQKVAGPIDARLNLIVERPIGDQSYATEFGYATSIDYAVYRDDIKIGVEAYGDFGTTDHFGGRQEHYIGPMGKFEIHVPWGSEIEIQTSYLFAAGAARDEADGQFKLIVGWEKRF